MGMPVSVPRYTVDDLEHFPNDGNRYELLDGVLLVTPAPRFSHQMVVSRLLGQLLIALGPPGHAWVMGPGAVSVPPRTQLEPDVLVLPARSPLPKHWREVSGHWLAIEVLSRSSRVYDRDFKRNAYLALGVLEVWIVDIDGRTIERSRADGPLEIVRDVLRWTAPVVDITIEIDLGALFAGIAEG